MDFKKMLEEIKARKSALLKELEGEVTAERMAEIETEQRNIEADEARIRSQMELVGKLGNTVEIPAAGPADNAEERAKQVKETGKLEISAAETRSALLQRSTTISSDTLAKPTKTGNEIADNLEMASSIVDQVTVSDLTGCGTFDEPYIKTDSVAGTRVDGAANASPSDPVFRVARIQPNIVNVTTYVSKNIARLTPLAYEAKVKALATKALRKKVADHIVNGVAGTFMGIKIAQNTKNENICKEYLVAANTINDSTLRNIVFQYGGSDELGGNARLFLTKEDLAAFGAVRGTNEKKAVYEIIPDTGNPNTGIIKDGGTIVPYTINSSLTSLSTATKGANKIQTMIYGDPKNFELGLFGPFTVEVSKDYKFAEGLLTVMGEVLAGGNVIVHEGFVVVTLAAQS